MSEKKSFVLFKDSLCILDDLTDEQAGKLFKAIYLYQVTGVEQIEPSLKLAFIPFRNQFLRDNEKYKNQSEVNSSNGSMGGRPRKAKETKKNESLLNKQNNPDSVSDKGSDSEKEKEILFERFWNLYDKKEGRKDCERKFNKLKPSDIEKIFQTLPDYIASTPDKKFRKLPETYLNGEHWNDEVARTPKMILPVQNIEFIPKGEDDNW